jgi:transcriptional regulator with XRE-family HTH domain
MESIFIPERLKIIRENRGLNKAEAARLLGLSKMGYLRYESAARTPSHQIIVFMAQKLGTSPEYLTGKTDNPEPNEYVISKSDDSASMTVEYEFSETLVK